MTHTGDSPPPASGDALYAQALDLYHAGAHGQAGELCRRVLAAAPTHVPALHLLGLCLWQAGDLVSAAAALRKAAELAPNDVELQENLGSVELVRGEFSNAIRRFEKVIALAPAAAGGHYKLAVASERFGRPAQAERAYRTALAIDPDYAPALAELAAMLERSNRAAEAGGLIERALALEPYNQAVRLVEAQLELRNGRVEQAAKCLQRLLARRLSANDRAIAQKRLGACFDRMGRCDEAFQLFAASNRLSAQAEEVAGPGWYTLEAIARIRTWLTPLLRAAEHSRPAGDRLVFLIGFPRSGTTLLDQMLSSHRDVCVIEEKATLWTLLRDFMSLGSDLQALVDADDSLLEKYRAAYWAEAGRWIGDGDETRIVVDKLPLNTILLPLMHRLFPSARFILALRDPRDVVLSCFMSSFGMNESMRHFVSLPSAAQYYAAVMSVAADSLPSLGSLVLSQRYEDMIADPEGEQRRLCRFLGIDWQEQMLRPHERARGRTINTPSYHQVAQPMYRRAVGRWRNYRRYLAPVLPALDPFVRLWDYETEGGPAAASS